MGNANVPSDSLLSLFIVGLMIVVVISQKTKAVLLRWRRFYQGRQFPSSMSFRSLKDVWRKNVAQASMSGLKSNGGDSYCRDTRLLRVILLGSSYMPLVIVVTMSLALASLEESSIIPLLYPKHDDVPVIGKLFFRLLPWSIAGTSALIVCGFLTVLAPRRISVKAVIILASVAFNTAVAWACFTVTALYTMNAVRNAKLVLEAVGIL